MSLLDLLGDYHSDHDEEETNVREESIAAEMIVTVVEGNVPQNEVLVVKNDVRHPFLASLPPPSSDSPHPALLDLLQQFQNQPNQSFDLIQNIKTNKSFGNPSLLSKIVNYFQIDELGTNFPKTEQTKN